MSAEFDKWAAQMEVFHRSHDGFVACHIVRHDYSTELLFKAVFSNDATTILVLRAIGGWIKDAAAYRPICLLCDTEFQRQLDPEVFAVFTPHPVDPERDDHHTIVGAICQQCADRYATNDQMHVAVLAMWKRLYPDARFAGPS